MLSFLKAGSHYAQVERSVTFLNQTILSGEALGLKKNIKIIQCHILSILMEEKFGLSTEVWVEHFARPKFAREAELLAP